MAKTCLKLGIRTVNSWTLNKYSCWVQERPVIHDQSCTRWPNSRLRSSYSDTVLVGPTYHSMTRPASIFAAEHCAALKTRPASIFATAEHSAALKRVVSVQERRVASVDSFSTAIAEGCATISRLICASTFCGFLDTHATIGLNSMALLVLWIFRPTGIQVRFDHQNLAN